MRRFVLLSLLVCLALFAIGCKSGAAVYGKYPGSTGVEYIDTYQPYPRTIPYVDMCCMLQGRLYCENPAEVKACLDQGGIQAAPGTIVSCCELGGYVVDYYSYAECLNRGGRPVSCS